MISLDPFMDVVSVDIKFKEGKVKNSYHQTIMLINFMSFESLQFKLNQVFDKVKPISKVDASMSNILIKIQKGLNPDNGIGRIININLTNEEN